MRLLQNKKAQWVRAQMREQRTNERSERVIQTYILKKEKYTIEAIALELGVSPNTISGYLREIKANPDYFETIYQERLAIAKQIETERIRKLTRTNKEIYSEEIAKGFKKGIIFTLIALLWWWIPSILIFVFVGVSSNKEFDVTNWIYSIKGFVISTIVVSSFISSYFVSTAISERDNYKQEKKK